MSTETNQLLAVLIDGQKEQTATNKELAKNLGELALKMEQSLARHDRNDDDIQNLKEFEEWAKPIVKRSEWVQGVVNSVFVKVIAPVLLIGILAAAGFSFLPNSIKTTSPQVQQNGNNTNH